MDLSWQEYAQHNMLSRLSQKSRDEYAFWTSPEQEHLDPDRAAREALRLLIPAYLYHQKFVPQLEKDLLNPNYSTPGLNQLVWKSMKAFDLKGTFAGFKAPTLIIDGRQDIMGEAVPMTIHQEIPNSILDFIDECSHYPWMDGLEEYFALITNFLGR
jgi:proline iminopeptidase